MECKSGLLLVATRLAFAMVWVLGCGDADPNTTTSSSGSGVAGQHSCPQTSESCEQGGGGSGGSSSSNAGGGMGGSAGGSEDGGGGNPSSTVTGGAPEGGAGGEGGDGGSIGEGGVGGAGGGQQGCPAWQPGPGLTCGTWTEEEAPAPLQLLSGFWASSPTDMFAVGGTYNVGKIIHNDGSGWSVQTTPSTRVINDIIGFASDDVWAVGRGPQPEFDGVLLHYDGVEWVTKPETPSVGSGGYNKIWGTSSSDLYVLAWIDQVTAEVYHWDGSDWINLLLPKLPDLSNGQPPEVDPGDIWGTADGRLWVVGTVNDLQDVATGGVVYYYDGSSWTYTLPGQATKLLAVHGSDACNIVAAGTHRNGLSYEVAVLRFNGTVWSTSVSSSAQVAEGVWVMEENKLFAVGSGNAIADGKFGTDDGNQDLNWSSSTPNLWLPRAVSNVPGTSLFYAVGDGDGAARLSHANCN